MEWFYKTIEKAPFGASNLNYLFKIIFNFNSSISTSFSKSADGISHIVDKVSV